MTSELDQTILRLNQLMLECVLRGDWQGYAAYCDPELSCFEAETNGILVEGLDFHRFYFPATSAGGAHNNANQATVDAPQAQVTMARPHLRWISNDAVVLSYTRLVQRINNGEFITNSCCETRIWQRLDGNWKQVHVHRS